MNSYKVMDLFAGAGGLSLGFQQAGAFNIVAAAENNKNAKITYKTNHPGVNMMDDVRKIDFLALRKKYGAIDVVIGGPPCQGFSNANRQKVQTISRNNGLVKEYVRAIRELQPTVFVMENVGMLRSDIHRFYYSTRDEAVIGKLNIELRKEKLELLPVEYIPYDTKYLIDTLHSYRDYLWTDFEYLVINVLYRQRRNNDKLKKAAKKYYRHIEAFIKKYAEFSCNNAYINEANHELACALNAYLDKDIGEAQLIGQIELPIMLQRMYMHYGELVDNEIRIDGYSTGNGICVDVTSFPIYEFIKEVLSAEPYCYQIASGVLNATDFGAPQKRERYIVIGTRNGRQLKLPQGQYVGCPYRTVRDTIADLEKIPTYFNVKSSARLLEPISMEPGSLIAYLRDSEYLYNHVITDTREIALERFAALKQGQNFHNLDDTLKTTYTDAKRTQNTIYQRLNYDQPSGTVVNVRKSMWVHPVLNRALSIREAARLQTFPDSFVFKGTKDAQYQQVGNAVPPILANAIARHVMLLLGDEIDG